MNPTQAVKIQLNLSKRYVALHFHLYDILNNKIFFSQTCVSLNISRHCSVCLELCSPVKLCGKCQKRAYCSRECQLVDWSPNGKGQGHKNWCHLDCGEEDIDWEVVSIPGKGLGIVAKRTIPPLYRIIVEGVYTDPYQHPGIIII